MQYAKDQRRTILCSLLVVLLELCPGILGRIGFKKDQKMDWEFPPRWKEKTTGIPQGHLRPLGFQSRPNGRLAEIQTFPTPQEFETKFINPARSVVMKGVLKNVPAATKWAKDDYLKANYAGLDVHVTVKKEQLTTGKRKTKFKKFLKEYHYEDWYLSNIIPTAMMSELILPKPLVCGEASRALLESEIWMSSGGTSSLLHAHADHDLHCLLSGRKDFVFIEAQYKDKLDWVDTVVHPGAGHSTMDVDMVNMFKYPDLADAPWTWATLYAGDCVYIPAGVVHQVRSFGRSFSWTVLWSPSNSSDFTDCKDLKLDQPKPLNEANFMWSYSHGDRHVTDEELNAETLRHHLLVLMRTEEKLRLGVFRDFYDEVMSEIDDYPEVEEVWQMMDTEKKNRLPRDTIINMDTEVLDKVAAILNKAHEGHKKKESKSKSKAKKDEL